ncbi:MAG: AMP-binding protein, partial [Dolichospermum sp.]
SLVNFIHTAIQEHEITDNDKILQFASINFDAALEEIFSTLASGATLVLRTAEMLNSFSIFLQKCRQWQLTGLFLPTAYWQQLISELVATDGILPETIRVINIGGERLLPDKLKLWQNYLQEKFSSCPRLPIL